MNWISNFVRPKINSLFSRREVPENLWDQVPRMRGHAVPPRDRGQPDGLHELRPTTWRSRPAGASRRSSTAGIFTEVPVPRAPGRTRCTSRDQKPYPQRLKAAQKATGEREAMLVAEGEIGRTPAVVAAQDFAFMAGSMGMYVGNAIVAAAGRAVERGLPLVLFAASGGARMQEGILSLMQMPRTTAAVQMLREAGLPYIVVLTHPTTGGVTASYAMLGDVQIAEPGALICFAGPAGHRADHPREAARGLPDGRIPPGARHARPGDAPARHEGRAHHDPADADAPAPRGGRRPAAARARPRALPSPAEMAREAIDSDRDGAAREIAASDRAAE